MAARSGYINKANGQFRPRPNAPMELSEAAEHDWTAGIIGNSDYKKMIYLQLSARHTYDHNKGWINAIGYRGVFPTSPTFEFNRMNSDQFGGQIECWLTNVPPNKRIEFKARIGGYTEGMAELTIGCSQPTQAPLQPFYFEQEAMDIILGNVIEVSDHAPGNQVPVTFTVMYDTPQYATWQFWDITFNFID
ncbi:MAG: hypothetical protein ABIV51_04545 [Saprospiraceae bacterium]